MKQPEVLKQSLKAVVRLLRGACPERHEILRYAQNDTKRRARNDPPFRVRLPRLRLAMTGKKEARNDIPFSSLPGTHPLVIVRSPRRPMQSQEGVINKRGGCAPSLKTLPAMIGIYIYIMVMEGQREAKPSF